MMDTNSQLIEEDNDGSGSIKDFREKMWAMAREEQEDPWIPYKWKFGVSDCGFSSFFHDDLLLLTEVVMNIAQDRC